MNTKGKNRSVQRTQALLKDGLTELTFCSFIPSNKAGS